MEQSLKALEIFLDKTPFKWHLLAKVNVASNAKKSWKEGEKTIKAIE